jgi:hypothetical protein
MMQIANVVASKKKPDVKITVYEDKSKETLGKKDMSYEGRLLGVVDNKKFNILAKNKDAVSKVFTGESLEVKDIPRESEHITSKRIVLVAKKRDNEFVGRTLFITEPLKTLSYTGPFKKSLGFITESGSYILVEDKKGDDI